MVYITYAANTRQVIGFMAYTVLAHLFKCRCQHVCHKSEGAEVNTRLCCGVIRSGAV